MTKANFITGLIRAAISAALALSVTSTACLWANDFSDNAVERAKKFFSDANTIDKERQEQIFYTACVFFNAAQYDAELQQSVKAVEIARFEAVEKRVDGTSRTRKFKAVRVVFSDKSVRYYIPGVLGTEFSDVAELNSPTRSVRFIEATKHEVDMKGYDRFSSKQRHQEEVEAFVRIWRTASKIKNSGDAQLDFHLTIRDMLAGAPILPEQSQKSDNLLRKAYGGITSDEAAPAPAWEPVKTPEATK